MLQALREYFWSEWMHEQSSNQWVRIGNTCRWDTQRHSKRYASIEMIVKEISVHLYKFFYHPSLTTTLLPVKREATALTSESFHGVLASDIKTCRAQNKGKIQNMVLRKWTTLIWPIKSFSVLRFEQNWRQYTQVVSWSLKITLISHNMILGSGQWARKRTFISLFYTPWLKYYLFPLVFSF